uniref:Uncharacterized protein n=1 Tax=Ignisphaera aggregans TaxID=334771 RepID=A0A7C2Z1H5_9CREN
MANKQLALVIAKIISDIGLDNVDVGSFDFRIVVQKIGYILQKVGCDVGLRFGWYSLGPYSRTLQNYYNTVAVLLPRVKHCDSIDFGTDLNACYEKTVAFLKEYVKYVGGVDLKSLEVLASLIMVCQDIYPIPTDPVNELLRRKERLTKDFVEKVFRFLIDKNICPQKQ